MSVSLPTVTVMVSGLSRIVGGDPRHAIVVARMAEDAGVAEYVVGDHVVMGERLDRYPYGSFGYGRDDLIAPNESWPEALTLLTAIAACTQRIRLVTGVLLVPLRPAALLAKTVATLDALSGGRVTLGVGTGWQREEYAALDVDWRARWAVLDATVRACRSLWAGETSVAPDRSRFAGVHCVPRPVQARMPVVLGARLDAVRASWIAEVGDGWMPLGLSDDELAEGIDQLRKAWSAAGRDGTPQVRAHVPTPRNADGSIDVGATRELAARAAARGVTHSWFILSPASGLASLADVERDLLSLGRCG